MKKHTIRMNQNLPAGFLRQTLQEFRKTGVISEAMRILLSNRRRQLGITASALAKLLDVTPQTVCNWEQGYTRHCRPIYVPPIIDFLKGKLSNELTKIDSRLKVKTNTWATSTPALSLDGAWEQFCKTYRLTASQPDIGDTMLRRLNQLSIQAIYTWYQRNPKKTQKATTGSM